MAGRTAAVVGVGVVVGVVLAASDPLCTPAVNETTENSQVRYYDAVLFFMNCFDSSQKVKKQSGVGRQLKRKLEKYKKPKKNKR